MINKNYKLKKTSDPFPYVVIDDFFSNDFYNELEKFFPKSEKFKINNVGRMHGDTTFGDDLYNNLMSNSEAYKNLHNWVYSENFINFCSMSFSSVLESAP